MWELQDLPSPHIEAPTYSEIHVKRCGVHHECLALNCSGEHSRLCYGQALTNNTMLVLFGTLVIASEYEIG